MVAVIDIYDDSNVYFNKNVKPFFFGCYFLVNTIFVFSTGLILGYCQHCIVFFVKSERQFQFQNDKKIQLYTI